MNFWEEKSIYFKKEKIVEINIYKMVFDSVKFRGTNKFPAPKYSIFGNYSTQEASLRDDIIQALQFWKYLGATLWGFNQWNLAKKFKMGP